MKSTPEETPLKHLWVDYFWEQEIQSRRGTKKQILLLNHMIFNFTESYHYMPDLTNQSN
jgi:hypothetical protein